MDAYSVALRLTLNNQITSGLIGISQALNRTHGDALKLKATLGDIKLLVTAGALTAGAGFLGLNLLSKTLPDAKEYAHQLAQMNIAGMKQAEIAKSINAAWALNKTVPTSTASQNLLAIREGRTVFGNTQEAINFLPAAQKFAYILTNTKGGDVQGETQALARAMDLRNATTTAAEATLQADMIMKAVVASGGVLSAKDFNQTFKYGRTATLGWSNEFAYTILPSLMQELKTGSGSGAGGGPGNPLMSAYAAVVQGSVPQKALGVWSELGLLDPTKVVRTSTGMTRGLKPGGIVGSDQFIENPYAWVQTTLRPALLKAGYDTEKEQRQVMGYLFPNRTAGAVMSTMLFQNRAIERDRRMIGIAQGMGAYDSLMKNDPRAADAALLAQWKNLMTVIGFEVLPVLVPLTLKLVDGLRGMAEWGRENRGMVKGLVIGFGALSTAMAFSGTLMLLVGGMKALGLTLKVMGVGKLFTLAKGISAVSTAAAGGPAAAAGLTALGGGIVAFAGLLANVAIPVIGFAAVGLSTARAMKYNATLKNPGAASPAELAAAIAHAEKNAGSYAGQIAGGNINPATGRRFQNKWLGEAATLRGGSPYIAAGAGGGSAAGGGNVYLDGKKVGAVVSDRIGQSLGHQYSVGRHDPSATLPSPAGGYVK